MIGIIHRRIDLLEIGRTSKEGRTGKEGRTSREGIHTIVCLFVFVVQSLVAYTWRISDMEGAVGGLDSWSHRW